MSDYDRGAYTPNHEPDVAFDATNPKDTGRRPLPLALIGSAVVLLVLVGAVGLAYRSGVRGEGEPPRAVGKPVLSVKTAGGPEAEPQDDAANLDVYAAQDKAAAAARAQAAASADPAQPSTAAQPSFAPDPEEPTTRAARVPAPAPVVIAPAAAEPKSPAVKLASPAKAATLKPAPKPVASTRATSDAAEPIRTSPDSKVEHAAAKPANAGSTKVAAGDETHAAAAPHVTTKAAASAQHANASVAEGVPATAKAPAVKTASAAKPPIAKAAKPAGAEPEASAPRRQDESATKPVESASSDDKAGAAHAGAVVQIGAFASAALADRGWSDVSSALPSAISGKAKRVQTVEKGGKTLFRTSVAGFASRADAVSFCEALKAKGKACFVKG